MAEADDDTAAGCHAADPEPHSWWRHVAAAGTAVVAVIALVSFLLIDLPADRAAARNEGVPGTATVTDESCGRRGSCTYDGTFGSDDGRLQVKGVYLVDLDGEVGDRLDAQYLASNDTVYSVGSGEWKVSVTFIAAAAAWIVGYGVWLGRDVRLRRRLRRGWPADHEAVAKHPRWSRAGRWLREISWPIVGVTLFATVMTLVAPMLVLAAIDERAATRGEGVAGTYTVVDDWSCRAASGCDTADFRSDDGRTVEAGVLIADELDADAGASGPAQYLDGTVYAVESGEWKGTLGFAGFVGFVALCSWIYVSVLRDDRRSATGSDAGRPE